MKYNIIIDGINDWNKKSYKLTGQAYIRKGGFEYGNGKMFGFKFENGEQYLYDIRYDTSYKSNRESEYIKKFVGNSFANVSNVELELIGE